MKQHDEFEMYKFFCENADHLRGVAQNRLMEDANHLVARKLLKVTEETLGLTYAQFTLILREFNKRFRDYIIETGAPLSFGGAMGNIKIVLKERRPRKNTNGELKYAINWGASLKLKKEIIARGGTPYNEETAPDGEKYIVYMTEGWVPYIKWVQSQYYLPDHKKKVQRYPYMIFSPSTGKYGFIAALQDHCKAQPEAVKHKYEKVTFNYTGNVDTSERNNQ